MGTLYCTKCGTSNEGDANFCFNCGQPMTRAQAVTDSRKAFAPADEPAPVREGRWGDEPAPPKVAPPNATTLKVTQSKSFNFIGKHWYGEYSLGVSYWLFGFLATMFIGILSVSLGRISDLLNLNTQQRGALILGYYLFIMAVSVWQVVGVTRSASAHVSRGGKEFWATAANVMICIGVIRLLYSFTVDGIPLIRESLDMVRGTDDIPPYSLRLMRNDTELELAGGIPHGTTDAVQKMLDSAPTIRVIHLNSTGGRIAEGTKLANLITQRQLITYTRTSCSSACALAFLAGRERYIGDQGRVGFHSASVNGSIGSADLNVNSDFTAALGRVGASPQFITKAITTDPKNMWFPSNDELKRQNIITSVVDSRYYGLSGIKDWRDANKVEETLQKVPVYAALATYDMDGYAKLRKLLVDGIQGGRSAAEIQTDIQSLIASSIIPNYIRRAPDQALLRYWRSQIAEMKYFGRTNPAYCVSFMGLDTKTPTVDIISKIPKELANEDLAALAEVVKQTATNPATPKPTSAYQRDFEKVMLTLMAKDRRAVEVVAAPEKFTHDPATTCNGMIMLYDTILALPDQRKAANLLRSMALETAL